MYISARVDYAMRALLTVAAAEAGGAVAPTADAVAAAQHLPAKFVENILVDLRRAGFVHAQRGAVGGYRLARPAAGIAVADVIRALEGPLAEVRGERPEHTCYAGAAANLQQVWIAVRASLRRVLEDVTIADVLSGRLPVHVSKLVDDPGAWTAR
ncbi:MAG: RrF2 family transcriptional regulator [Acidimicrobiales bacterium]